MAISGNPKKLAQDVAGGFFSLSPPVLKKYTPGDLKIILNNLNLKFLTIITMVCTLAS